jgi:hypothetical protein
MAQQRDPYEIVTALIDQYNTDPSRFNIQQIQEIKSAADELGIKFSPQEDLTRMMKNAAFGLADTATFGFLPDNFMGYQIKPDQLTTADQVAEGVGGLLGFAVPFAAGGKVAGATVKGLEKIAAGQEIGFGKKAFSILEGMGQRAAQAVPGRAATMTAASEGAAKGLTTVFEKTRPYVEKGAKFLTKNPDITRRAIQFGVASGLSNLGNDIGNGDLMKPIARTFGGAVGGGAAGIIGKYSPMAAQFIGLSNKVGSPTATKIIAAAIYANMTAPEKEMYPKDYVEHFVKYAALTAFAK